MASKEFLEARGHAVEEVFAGKNLQREIPEYVNVFFNQKLRQFYSPNFIRKVNKKGILVIPSIIINLFLSPVYLFEIFRLLIIIRQSKADIIVNFYDMIAGIAFAISLSNKKHIAVSHHFFHSHPAAVRVKNHSLSRWLLQVHSFMVARKSDTRVALSFSNEANIIEKNLIVAPPLLRAELFSLKPQNGQTILAYFLNEGFISDLIEAASKHNNERFKVFSDPLKNYRNTLSSNIEICSFDQDFLKELSRCKAYIGTAGFESVCEAAWLGKRIFLLPSQHHYEQLFNAMDAKRAGLAEWGNELNINTLSGISNQDSIARFRKWLEKKDEIYERLFSSHV